MAMSPPLAENPSMTDSGVPLARRPPRIPASELIAGFDPKGIKRVRVSIVYRIGLLVVALVMIALPLIYLAMVGSLAYGLYLHAVNNISIFNEVHSARAAVAIYLGPLLLGGIVLFFLVKPLLAPKILRIPPRYVKPEEQPTLYAFVEHLCRIVRAPIPSRIAIDCQVNAAAGPTGGLFSLLTGNLTLTLGLPLVTGLNLRQLTGVIAHEFGHFGQGGGMTLTYIIRRTSGWFARVVYERDQWDAWLEGAGSGGDPRGRVLLWFARLCVWISRRVLWVLMWAGHIISCFMLRQMEFDADRYEARISGSEDFVSTAGRIRLLSIAWNKTCSDLRHAFEERRLGDNLPVMIAHNCDHMPAEVRVAALEAAEKDRTSFLQTHPSDSARSRSARRENTEGIFHDERRADCLFFDFDQLCRHVSMDFYAGTLGGDAARAQLVPTAELVGRQKAAEDSMEAAHRYSFGMLLFGQMIVPETTQLCAPDDAKASALSLKKHRDRLLPVYNILSKAIDLYKDADRQAFRLRVADEMLQARLRFSPKDFGLNRASADAVQEGKESALRLRDDALTELHPCIHALRTRMHCALQLLYTPQVKQRLKCAKETTDSAERLVQALRSIEMIEPSFDKINAAITSLDMLLRNLKGHEQDEDYIGRIKKLMRRTYGEIEQLLVQLKYTEYPFSQGGKISLGEYLVGIPPSREHIGDIMNKGADVLDRCHRFYFRAMGALALIGEEVEAILGLPRLEKPAPPEKKTEDADIY